PYWPSIACTAVRRCPRVPNIVVVAEQKPNSGGPEDQRCISSRCEGWFEPAKNRIAERGSITRPHQKPVHIHSSRTMTNTKRSLEAYRIDYQWLADQCRQLARKVSTEKERAELLEIAIFWDFLADRCSHQHPRN